MLRPICYLVCFVLAMTGCADDESGGVHVDVSVQSLSASDVHSVRITITGQGMAPVVEYLVKTPTSWQGTIGSIPVGSDRVFLGEGLAADGSVLYAGTTTGVLIRPKQTALVQMILQETMPPPPFENSAPRISWLYLSSTAVAPGDVVALDFAATDLDGDALTFVWTSTAGALATTGETGTWTAPTTEGMYQLTAIATDARGAHDGVGVTIHVAAAHARGSASVAVTVNTFPRVVGITADLGHVPPGEALALEVTMLDADNDALTPTLASTCAGLFSAATTMGNTFATTFTRLAGTEDTCTFTASLDDGRGGTGTGTFTVSGLEPPTPTLPPQVDSTFQSSTSAGHSDPVVLRVKGHDPQGGAVTFSWAAPTGTMLLISNDASGSEIQWTAPVCFTGTATITATLDSADGQTSVAFTVDALDSACLPTGLIARWNGETLSDVYGGRQLVPDGPGMSIDPRGVRGTSYGFDGSGQGAAAVSTLMPAGGAERTLEMWVLVDAAAPGVQLYFGGWGRPGTFGAAFYLGGFDSLVPFVTNWGQDRRGGMLSLGTWHHVAATVQQSTGFAELFVDGSKVAEGTMTIDTHADQPFRIGALAASGGRLDGAIDEIRVYNRRLSGAEIAGLAAGF